MLQPFRLALTSLLLTPMLWAQFGSGFQGTIVDRSTRSDSGSSGSRHQRRYGSDQRGNLLSRRGLHDSQPQPWQLQDPSPQGRICQRFPGFPGFAAR